MTPSEESGGPSGDRPPPSASKSSSSTAVPQVRITSSMLSRLTQPPNNTNHLPRFLPIGAAAAATAGVRGNNTNRAQEVTSPGTSLASVPINADSISGATENASAVPLPQVAMSPGETLQISVAPRLASVEYRGSPQTPAMGDSLPIAEIEAFAAEMVARGAKEGRYVTAQDIFQALVKQDPTLGTQYQESKFLSSPTILAVGSVDRDVRAALKAILDRKIDTSEEVVQAMGTPTKAVVESVGLSTAWEFLRDDPVCKPRTGGPQNGPLSTHPVIRTHYGLLPDAPIPKFTSTHVMLWLRDWLALRPPIETLVNSAAQDDFRKYVAKRMGLPGPGYVGISVNDSEMRREGLRGLEGVGWTAVLEMYAAYSQEKKRGKLASAHVPKAKQRGPTLLELSDISPIAQDLTTSSPWRHSPLLVRAREAEEILEKARKQLDQTVEGGGDWLVESYNIAYPNLTLSSTIEGLAKNRIPIESSPGPKELPLIAACCRLWAYLPQQFEATAKWIGTPEADIQYLKIMAQEVQRAVEQDLGSQHILSFVAGAWDEQDARRANLGALVAATVAMAGLDLATTLVMIGEMEANAAMSIDDDAEKTSSSLPSNATHNGITSALPPGSLPSGASPKQVQNSSPSTPHPSVSTKQKPSKVAHPLASVESPISSSNAPTKVSSVDLETRVVRAFYRAMESVGGIFDPTSSSLNDSNTPPVYVANLEKLVCSQLGVVRFEDLALKEKMTFGQFVLKHLTPPSTAASISPAELETDPVLVDTDSDHASQDADVEMDNAESDRSESDAEYTKKKKARQSYIQQTLSSAKSLSLADLAELTSRMEPLALLRYIASHHLTLDSALDPALIHVTRPELGLLTFAWQCAQLTGYVDDHGKVNPEKKQDIEYVLEPAFQMQYHVETPADLGLSDGIGWMEVVETALSWRKTLGGTAFSDEGVFEVALLCSLSLRHYLHRDRMAEQSGQLLVVSATPHKYRPKNGGVMDYHAALMRRDAIAAARVAGALIVHSHMSSANESSGRGDVEALVMATRDFVTESGDGVSRIVLTAMCNEFTGWLRTEVLESVVTRVVAKEKWKEWTEARSPSMIIGGELPREQKSGQPTVPTSDSHQVHASSSDSMPAPADGSYSGTQTAIRGSHDNPHWVVDDIRRSEFGIGVEDASPEVELVLKRQRERVERALKRLGTELYSSDTHFALELIQNADDNRYENLSPASAATIQFILTSTAIIIRNNEDGFSESDLRSLCDVGRSTKESKSGSFIGRKGVGFKSVFRVSAQPEIHSNGFHIRFDAKSFVVPEWIGSDSHPLPDDNLWATKIVLPLPHILAERTNLMETVVDARLLIFLRKVKTIQFIDLSTPTDLVKTSIFKSPDHQSRIVEVVRKSDNTADSTYRWLIVRKIVDIPAWSRKDSETATSGELALAFSLKVPAEPQPAFAYLPLRTYGLKFIVQGDFAVPSSREDIDSDHPRNVLLRNEVPNLFAEAFQSWVKLPQEILENQSLEETIVRFMEYIPDFAEGFFRALVPAIQAVMRTTPCLLTTQGEWTVPSGVLQAPTDSVTVGLDIRQNVSSDDLKISTGKSWLNEGLILSENICRMLKVEMVNVEQLARTITNRLLSPSGELYAILARVVESRSKGKSARTDLELLRKAKIFVLADGRWVSSEENDVFFPDEDDSGASTKRYEFLTDLKVLDMNAFQTAGTHRAAVMRFLDYVGVKRTGPHDIIHHYIIRVFRTGNLHSYSKIVSCLRYVKDHTTACDSCSSDDVLFQDLRQVLPIPTTKGWFQTTSNRGIYLPTILGGSFELNDARSIDLLLVDPQPLELGLSSSLEGWQIFFEKLGCHKWFTPAKRLVACTGLQELPNIDFLSAEAQRNLGDGPWVVEDFDCPDLVEVLSSFSKEEYYSADSEVNQAFNWRFAIECDQKWGVLMSYCKMGTVTSSLHPNAVLYQFPSTVVRCFQTLAWLRSGKSCVVPKGTFLPLAEIQQLVGDLVVYCPALTDRDFMSILGVKASVSLEDICTILDTKLGPAIQKLEEGELVQEFVRRNLDLLRILVRHTDANELQVWSKKPIICTPRIPASLKDKQNIPFTDAMDLSAADSSGSDHPASHSPLLRNPCDVFWTDPASVKQHDGWVITSQTLEPHYQEFADAKTIFCSLGVREVPTPQAYLEALQHVVNSGPPSKMLIGVVRGICDALSDQLLLPRDRSNVATWKNNPWKVDGSESGELVEQIKAQLRELLLFPSHRRLWISASNSGALINDDPIIAEHIHDPNIHFLFSISDGRGSLAVTPATVRRMLDALGVCRLSQTVTCIPNPDNATFSDEWDHRLAYVMPYLQRYLRTFKKDLYERSGPSICTYLSKVPVMLSPNCGVKYKVLSYESDHVPLNCILTGNNTDNVTLWVDKRSFADLEDIYVQLSRILDESGNTDEDVARFLDLISRMAEDGVKEFCIKEGVDELPDDEIPWTRPVKNPSNAFAKAPQVNATSEEDIQPSENNEEEFKPLDGLSSTEAASNNRKRKVPDSGSSVPVVDIDGDDDAIDVDADVSGATGNDVPLVQQPPVKRTRRSNHGFASSGGYINYGAGPPPAANPLDELQEWNRQLWGKVTATSTGRFGERYVAETLRRTHRENPNVRVNWINELEETGEKWDIEVITKMGEGRDDKIQYVEVKTTRFADKKWFEMSHRELTMALKEGPNFTVVRVFLNIQDLGGDVANFEPVLVYLDDFESLFRQGKVKVRVEM